MRKFVPRKNDFVPTSFCRRATLTLCRILLQNVVTSVGIGLAARGSCNNTLLRRVLRSCSNNKCFLEGFLAGACKGFQ